MELMTMAGTERPGRELVEVTVSVPAVFGCRTAEVAGDFTAWSPVVMRREVDGAFSLAVRLEPGRRWHYRFRLDGDTWVNDPAAADYVQCGDGGAVSVLET